jgi:hypothetical protein
MLGALFKLKPKGALALPLQEHARVIGVSLRGFLMGEFCEKLFDCRPIFFGPLWVLVF